MHCSLLISGHRASGRALWAAAGLLWLGVAAHAESRSACVRCAGPDQTYRCNVMSDEAVAADAVRYFCMSQIAREHVHESCAVLRGAASCDGVDLSYVYQDGVDGQAVVTDALPPPSSGDNTEPGTLADMTRPAFEASMRAGKAVSEATKRTLKCLGSALNGC
jgi:hypothetical protein